MLRLYVLILVGWLALAGVCAELDWEEPSRQDFNDLNRFLRSKLPQNDDRDANLAQIKSGMDEMSAGAKKAAHLVLTLLGREGDQCTVEAMTALLALRKTGLNNASYLVLSRVETLMRTSWIEAFQVCEVHVENSYKNSTKKLIRFSRAFNKYRHSQSYERQHKKADDDHYLNEKLRTLAKDFPKIIVIFNWMKKQFDVIFDQELVEPCKLINSKTRVLDNMASVTLADSREYKDHGGKDFSVKLCPQLDNLNWLREVCVTILNSDNAKRMSIYKAWLQ